MAYCYKCGKPLIDGDRFCTHCGTEQSYITGGHKHNQERKHVPPIELHPVRWINNLAIVQTIKRINFWKIIRLFVLAALAIGGILFAFHAFESNSAADVQEEEQIQSESNMINGHEYVDLGLSVKWATCNIGADSPEEYGDYFAWGETCTKDRYDWDNYFDCINTNHYILYPPCRKYKNEGGQTMISPSSSHDAARENWGGTWRLPSGKEFAELVDECDWEWTIRNNIEGVIITGPNNNSIFLPACGTYDKTQNCDNGDTGSYWSNQLCSIDSHSASYLHFYYNDYNGLTKYVVNNFRKIGRNVRPVSE